MDFGAALGGIASGVGSFFGAKESANAARDVNSENVAFGRDQMQFSAQQAQKQMDFQREMSNTQYSRAATDLQRAGINPMLAAGAPASAPAGAAGSSATSAPSIAVPSVGAAVAGGVQQALRLFQDMRESNSRIVANLAGGDSAKSQSFLNDAKNRLTTTENELMMKQNDILANELSFRQKHPGGTGMLDVIKNYVPFISSGATAASLLK